MNFLQRIKGIRQNLNTAIVSRNKWLAKIPKLKLQIAAQGKVVDNLEKEINRFYDAYNVNSDLSWELIVTELEKLDEEECDILSDLETALEDAENSVGDIEAAIEAASYDAADATSY